MIKKLALLAILLTAGIGVFWNLAYPGWLKSPSKNAQVVHVEIEPGTTGQIAAKKLESAGVISSAFWYRVYSRLDSKTNTITVGEYSFNEGMSFSAVARLLARGPERKEVSITIIEGWTIRDIEAKLTEMGVEVRPSDFYAERFEDEFAFLKDLPNKTTLEGFLYPDTYRVWADELPDGLFRKQLAEFELKTEEVRGGLEAQGRNLYDVLILASIVEKEALFDEDRPKIAGVFKNRLEIGMALQSDATLNYIIDSGRSRLTAQDLKNTSPYNTYQHAGLPPTPIGNPSLESLSAAFAPEDHSYLFFLTDENGKVYYGRNLEEHAVNRFRVFGE